MSQPKQQLPASFRGSSTPDTDAARTKAPSCSFGQRTRILSEEPKAGPGPQFYDVSYCWDRIGKRASPSFSFGTGKRFPGKEVTPGPGKYSPDDVLKDKRPSANRATTFGSRDLGKSSIFPISDNPGPGSYNITDLNKVKRSGPSISMGIRIPSRERKAHVPAPNAYQVDEVKKTYTKDKCTFGLRQSKNVTVARNVKD